MKIKHVIILPLLALPLLFGPTPGAASPPIRIRTRAQIDKNTDYVVRVKLLSRTTRKVGTTSTTRIRVKVLSAKAKNKRARAHRRLVRGAILEFSRSCSLRRLLPHQQWRLGYPNGRCSSGYSAMPSALFGARGKIVTLRLRLVKPKGKKAHYETVPTTFPTTAWAKGRRIK